MKVALLVLASGIAITASLASSDYVLADDQDHPTTRSNYPTQTQAQAEVRSRSNGVDYQVTVRQQALVSEQPIRTGGETSPRGGFTTGVSEVTLPQAQGPLTVSSVPVTSAWPSSMAQAVRPDDHDAVIPTGHAPNGNEFGATGVNLGTFATSVGDPTKPDLQSRPTGAVPAFTADGQFQGLVTLPGAPVPMTAAATPDAVVPPAPAPAPQPAAVAAAPPSGGGGADPRDVAMDIRGHVPLPDIQIGVNPSPAGIVAIPTWYWVEGYDGRAFGASRTVDIPAEIGAEVPIDGPGAVPADDPRRQGSSFSVEVHIAPTSYQWSFGDGSALEGHSLGQPYPATSDIQHTYQYSSMRQPGGFPLNMTVTFSVDYRVNGGAPQELPPITRTSQMTYRVQEIQTVLTSR